MQVATAAPSSGSDKNRVAAVVLERDGIALGNFELDLETEMRVYQSRDRR